jgi:hypothetical protein
MATPVQNLWPETRAVAATVVLYSLEDQSTFYELIENGDPDATLVSPNGFIAIDPTKPTAEFRVLSVGTSPISLTPTGA